MKKMARFDLENYATVGERLAKFHEDYPDGRIITEWINTYEETDKPNYVVKATVYLSAGDQANGLAKATGHAAEQEGNGGASNIAPLPNSETSAIGRALMVMGYSMNKDPKTLASRQEMMKVQPDYIAQADSLDSVEALRTLYTTAKANNAPQEVLERLKDRANQLTASEAEGTGRGVSNSKVQGKRK
jgi:hypothetical protein